MSLDKVVVYRAGQVLQRVTSRTRMLPSFLVVGAKPAATTSTYQYLVRHPGALSCAMEKGTHYFDIAFGRGWGWYRSSFPLAGRDALVQEPQRLAGEHERMVADPNRAMQPLWRFLGLEPFTIVDSLTYKAGDGHERMSAPTRMRLKAYFDEHNQRLYRLPGVGFRWPPPGRRRLPRSS